MSHKDRLFSALLSTIYERVCTSAVMASPIIGSSIIIQEVGYSEDSAITLSLRRKVVLTLSGSYINSRPGK